MGGLVEWVVGCREGVFVVMGRWKRQQAAAQSRTHTHLVYPSPTQPPLRDDTGTALAFHVFTNNKVGGCEWVVCGARRLPVWFDTILAGTHSRPSTPTYATQQHTYTYTRASLPTLAHTTLAHHSPTPSPHTPCRCGWPSGASATGARGRGWWAGRRTTAFAAQTYSGWRSSATPTSTAAPQTPTPSGS